MKYINTLVLFVVLAWLVAGTASADDATQFDGKWIAEAITEVGNCKDKYSFKFKVKKGYVKGKIKGQEGSYKLTGPIVVGGGTELALDGFDSGRFYGVFVGGTAKGNWKTRNCSGSFTFVKKV